MTEKQIKTIIDEVGSKTDIPSIGAINQLDHKELMFPNVVLEKTLETPLEYKEIKPANPEYSLEGLMMKLKPQYSGHLMQRADSLEQTPMLRKIKAKGEGGNRG